MRRFLTSVLLMGVGGMGLWADIVPTGVLPGVGGVAAVPTGGGVDPMYTFSDLAGDVGTVDLNLAPTSLGDGSYLAISGSLDLTGTSNPTDLPLGTYALETLNPSPGSYWAISPLGAFSADNLVYTNDEAGTGTAVYETGSSLPPYYVPISNPSYLTNGGLMFDGTVSINSVTTPIEINIFGIGGGNYEFYEGLGAGNYPIQQASGGTYAMPEPSSFALLAMMAALTLLPVALRRKAS